MLLEKLKTGTKQYICCPQNKKEIVKENLVYSAAAEKELVECWIGLKIAVQLHQMADEILKR